VGLQYDASFEDVLLMAHDESLAQREFERINRALELFPVVQDILLKEAAQRAFYQSDPPSPIDALCNTHLASPEIIPTLVALLPQVKHPRVKEAIVRALTVKEARGIANSALIEQLRQVPWSAELHQEYLTLAVAHRELGDFDKLPVEMQHRLRTLASWESLLSAFGNALWYLARRENLPYLLEIVRDPRYGSARAEIVRAVVRLRPEGLRELLLDLLQDPDDGLALEAARGLARLKVREARKAILARFSERMAKRGQGEFRKMVEKLVARLGE
jgi:HEAT repeat protein